MFFDNEWEKTKDEMSNYQIPLRFGIRVESTTTTASFQHTVMAKLMGRKVGEVLDVWNSLKSFDQRVEGLGRCCESKGATILIGLTYR